MSDMRPPGIGDPAAKRIGIYTSKLCKQDAGLQKAIASLRRGVCGYQEGFNALPHPMCFIADDGTLVSGETDPSLVSIIRGHDIHLVLSSRDGNVLTWEFVDINGENIEIQIYENPPEG